MENTMKVFILTETGQSPKPGSVEKILDVALKDYAHQRVTVATGPSWNSPGVLRAAMQKDDLLVWLDVRPDGLFDMVSIDQEGVRFALPLFPQAGVSSWEYLKERIEKEQS